MKHRRLCHRCLPIPQSGFGVPHLLSPSSQFKKDISVGPHVPTRSTPPLPNTAWPGPHPGPIPLNFFSNPFKTKLLRETFHTLFFISDETVVGLEPGTLLHLQDKAAEEVPRTPAQAAALWQLGWHYS